LKEERREKENQPSGEQLDAARQTRVWRPVKWERKGERGNQLSRPKRILDIKIK
jgi:hypothetical protein